MEWAVFSISVSLALYKPITGTGRSRRFLEQWAVNSRRRILFGWKLRILVLHQYHKIHTICWWILLTNKSIITNALCLGFCRLLTIQAKSSPVYTVNKYSRCHAQSWSQVQYLILQSITCSKYSYCLHFKSRPLYLYLYVFMAT